MHDSIALAEISCLDPKTTRWDEWTARVTYIYSLRHTELPPEFVPDFRDCSYSILAKANIDMPDAEGVLVSHGNNAERYSLFVKGRRLHYSYNDRRDAAHTIRSVDPIPLGVALLRATFTKMPEVNRGIATLLINGAPAGAAALPAYSTSPTASEHLCLGHEPAGAGAEYTDPFPLTGGSLRQVVIGLSTPLSDPEL